MHKGCCKQIAALLPQSRTHQPPRSPLAPAALAASIVPVSESGWSVVHLLAESLSERSTREQPLPLTGTTLAATAAGATGLYHAVKMVVYQYLCVCDVQGWHSLHVQLFSVLLCSFLGIVCAVEVFSSHTALGASHVSPNDEVCTPCSRLPVWSAR